MTLQHQAARRRENFPVASFLIPHSARQDVLSFYDFARGADNIADNPDSSADTRLEQLHHLSGTMPDAAAIPIWARRYRSLITEGRLPAVYGDALLTAFRQDVVKDRYDNLQDLLEYCEKSAAPVGRALLALCHEHDANLPAADALCHSLQILNHLQDMQADYRHLNRIYLPMDWMKEEGVEATDLLASASSAGVHRLIGRLLDVCDTLIQQSHPLIASIRSFRLRAEIATIRHIARTLSHRLRHRDPLAEKVRLPRWQYGLCVLAGLKEAL